MSGKRGYYQSLGMPKKFEILQLLRGGVSASSLARVYGIPRTTINEIRKNGDKIENFMSKMEASDGDITKRKRMTSATNALLDEAMFMWFSQQRSQGIPLSGPVIIQKALQMNMMLNGDPNFKASQGWLEKFKARHGIRELSTQGEKMSANCEVVSRYREKLIAKINSLGLSREQVYNCDEFGLNWKALPRKTVASVSESSAPGYKKIEERITILACSNASGSHRLPLAVIGEEKKPKAFKNLNLDLLPAKYFAQNNAWMSQEIFTKWFNNDFVPQVKLHLKRRNLSKRALLLLDNAPIHPIDNVETADEDIMYVFLPANMASLIQPMDQGIIKSLKWHYRKLLLQNLIFCENELQVEDFWKKYTVKDAIYNVADAWESIPQALLNLCWNKLWPAQSKTTVEEIANQDASCPDLKDICLNIPGFENMDERVLKSWCQMDDTDLGYEILTEEDIIAHVTSCPTKEKDDNEHEPFVCEISHREAETMLSKCIMWYEKQEEAEMTKLIVLRQIRRLAIQKERNSLMPKQITDFVKR